MVARPGGKQKTQEKKTERYRADHPKVYGLQTSCARIACRGIPTKQKPQVAACGLCYQEKRKGKMKN